MTHTYLRGWLLLGLVSFAVAPACGGNVEGGGDSFGAADPRGGRTGDPSSLGRGGENEQIGDGGQGAGGPGSGAAGGGGRGAPTAPTGGVTGSGGTGGAIPDELAELSEFYSVWIGETDRPVTYPERDLVSGPQRVALLLDPIGAEVTGTVVFGTREPPPPSSGPAEPYPPRLASWGAVDESIWLTVPYEGFEYALLRSHATATGLSLAFSPWEIFAEACPDDPPEGWESFCWCPSPVPENTFTLAECQEGRAGFYQVDLAWSGDQLQGEIRMTFRDESMLAAWVRLVRVR